MLRTRKHREAKCRRPGGLEQQMGGGGRDGVKCTGGASGVKLCSLSGPNSAQTSALILQVIYQLLISNLNLAYSLACLSTLLLWPGCELSPTGSHV